jgi:glycosyltransferase involved in cell wall biosynthesis
VHFSIVTNHVPEPEGTASGRALLALCEGLLAEGHGVDVWSWRDAPPEAELPAWCRWAPLRRAGRWVAHAKALRSPRWEPGAMGWQPAEGAIALSDTPESWTAVAPFPRSAVSFHYSMRLDRVAAGKTFHYLQNRRNERRAVRGARIPLALSARVAAELGGRPTVVPIGYPMPEQALPVVERPVAGLLANWAWPPNRVALGQVMAAWPQVRERVPGAELVIAGRGAPGVAPRDGVRIMGAVPRSADFLEQVAVVVFPAPPSSGPKVKVLEAMSYGVPVLTTSPGIEGLAAPREAVAVGDDADFAEALSGLLSDPQRRAGMAAAARRAAVDHHAPAVSARAWVEACRSVLQPP